MRYFIFFLFSSAIVIHAQTPTGDEILKKVDQTMVTENKIVTSRMNHSRATGKPHY